MKRIREGVLDLMVYCPTRHGGARCICVELILPLGMAISNLDHASHERIADA